MRNEVKSIAKLFYKESDNIESVLTPTPGNTEFSYSKSAEDNSPDTVVIEPSFSKIYRPAPQSRKYAIHKRVGSYKWEPPLSMTSPPFTTSTAISNSSTKISSQQLHEDRIPPALDYTINSNNLGSLDTGDSPHMNPKVACTHSYTISESIEVKQSQQDSILPSSAIYNPLVEYIKKYNAKFNDIFKTLNAYKNFIAQLPDKTLAEQSINEFINNKLPLDLQSLILQVDNGRKVYGPESLIAKLHEKIYTMNSKLEYFKQFYSFMDSENYIERLLLKVEKVVSLIRISPAISGIFYILLSEESKEASQPMPASYKKLQMRKK